MKNQNANDSVVVAYAWVNMDRKIRVLMYSDGSGIGSYEDIAARLPWWKLLEWRGFLDQAGIQLFAVHPTCIPAAEREILNLLHNSTV